MFTDIVGYTALGQDDEQASLRLLEKHRQLLRPIFSKHSGREIKTIGDAFLVEFPSALEATLCAIDVQSTIHSRNLERGEELQVRIGIHLGDVVHQGNDVLGDAVNVASRIEPLATPGGVCISEQVHDHVKSKIPYPLVRIDAGQLKNVKERVGVYRVVLPWDERAAPRETPSRFDRRRVAILPFVNMSPDPADEYFADGMTEELISTMAKIRGLSIIARTSVMGYKGSQKKISEVARELEVGTVLEGSVRKAGDRLRIAVQLIDSQTSGHRWAESYDRELKDVFALQSEISKTVANALEVQLLTEDREKVEKEPTQNPEAHQLYLKGRYFWNERSTTGLEKATKYFEAAVEKDPSYAFAYVGIADAYGVLVSYQTIPASEGLPKMEANLRKALELDDSLGEAHAGLGGLLSQRWQWARAEMEFRRAIELNPGYPTAHHWYATFLEYQGRTDEALAEMEKARKLDPLSLIMITATGVTYHFRREYDRAIEWHKKALSIDPDFVPAVINLAGEYIQVPMIKEAQAIMPKLESTFGESPGMKTTWASLYAVLGRTDDAYKALREAEAIRGERYISPTDIAQAYVRLGEIESAFKWLNMAYEEKSSGLVDLRVEPAYDPIRSDPRFGDLLRRVGLST